MGRTRHRGLLFQPEDYSQIELNEMNRLNHALRRLLMALSTLSLFEQAHGRPSTEIDSLMRQLHSRSRFSGGVLVAGQGAGPDRANLARPEASLVT